MIFFAALSPASASSRFSVVLIAGDGSLPVFDNAVSAFRAQLLLRRLAVPDRIHVLSASGPAVADVQAVQRAIAAMRPGPGEGCLVYATSHGERKLGLYLSADDSDLAPAALDAALRRGCGDAPTVVILSACFSGQFARGVMRRPNRIILTAARPDRTSFGCAAGRQFTVFDRCLLDAFPEAQAWRGLFADMLACVASEERAEDAYPSDPQGFFGTHAENLLPAPEN